MALAAATVCTRTYAQRQTRVLRVRLGGYSRSPGDDHWWLGEASRRGVSHFFSNCPMSSATSALSGIMRVETPCASQHGRVPFRVHDPPRVRYVLIGPDDLMDVGAVERAGR